MNGELDFNDAAAIERRWRDHVGALWGAGTTLSFFRQLSAGFSWRTFAFATAHPIAGATEFILQIGPPNGLFAPYATAPQRLALSSLEGSGVPAPRVLAADDGGRPFDAPWLVTERLPGEVPLPWTLRTMPEAEAHALALDFVDLLARLHRVPVPGCPAAALDPACTAENANLRQVDHWSRAIARWQRRAHPALALAGRWLREHAPRAPVVALVHGDYRIGNFLRRGDAICGLLDWEMVHLGDPHEDLAWALLPAFNGGSRALFGRLAREDAIARYGRASGLKVDRAALHFHQVLALYKSAAIDLAAIARYEDAGLRDLRLAAMGTQVAPFLKQLLRLLDAQPAS